MITNVQKHAQTTLFENKWLQGVDKQPFHAILLLLEEKSKERLWLQWLR